MKNKNIFRQEIKQAYAQTVAKWAAEIEKKYADKTPSDIYIKYVNSKYQDLVTDIIELYQDMDQLFYAYSVVESRLYAICEDFLKCEYNIVYACKELELI